MKLLTLLSAVMILFPEVLPAQWPTSSIGGKVDRNGPTPRTADGKPDFSGVWESGGIGGPGGPAGGPLGPPPGGRPPPGGPPPPRGGAANGIPRGDFRNIGMSLPGGLPYTPWALELRNKRLARNSKDHPDAHCLPLNPVQLWFHPQPRKLIQAPGVTVMLAEANGGTRQVFTNGRALPSPANVQPWWYGYSVGRWEGDTLVVESTGFLDEAWIDEQGSPLTNQAHVTERIRRPNYGTLEIEITVSDPKAYSKTWTVSSTQRLMDGDELIEFICAENNTSVQHLGQ